MPNNTSPNRNHQIKEINANYNYKIKNIIKQKPIKTTHKKTKTYNIKPF
jgi:hypothetical protein